MSGSHRTSHRQGFAVITALLILVAVGALAVGAFFMTITNLRLAENTRTQAVAKYNAELWLDVALMVIADGYVELGRIPTLAELTPFLIASDEYEITRYDVNSPGTIGEIQVTGRALRGDAGAAVAQHPVSARFQATTSAGGSPGGPGFITPADINVSGASTLLLNMHAGTSLDVAGNVNTGNPALGQLFSYKSGTGGCNLGTAGTCEEGADPPEVEALDWEAEYADAWSEYCEGEPVEPTPSGNTTRSVSVIAPGTVVCLPDSGRFDITGGPLRDVTIVGGPDTQVTVSAGSERAVPTTSDPDDIGLRLVAGDVILTSGNTLQDRNLLVARGNVVLNRGVTQTEIEEEDDDGVVQRLTVVKTLIRAGNDVVFTGSGTRGTYAEIIVNGKFCRSGNGGARFVGSITAAAGTPYGTNLSGGQQVCADNRAAIDFRGGGGWTAALPDRFDTGDPRDPQPTGLTVLARRP